MNSPIRPERIIPPMAPMRITSMGTGTPRPSSIGFSTPSLRLTSRLQTAKKTAITVLSWLAKTQKAIGPRTSSGGSWTIATIITSRDQSPAPGTPATTRPTAASRPWIRATSTTPLTTLRMVPMPVSTIRGPASPAMAPAIARAAREPPSAFSISRPAMTRARRVCAKALPMPLTPETMD